MKVVGDCFGHCSTRGALVAEESKRFLHVQPNVPVPTISQVAHISGLEIVVREPGSWNLVEMLIFNACLRICLFVHSKICAFDYLTYWFVCKFI